MGKRKKKTNKTKAKHVLGSSEAAISHPAPPITAMASYAFSLRGSSLGSSEEYFIMSSSSGEHEKWNLGGDDGNGCENRWQLMLECLQPEEKRIISSASIRMWREVQVLAALTGAEAGGYVLTAGNLEMMMTDRPATQPVYHRSAVRQEGYIGYRYIHRTRAEDIPEDYVGYVYIPEGRGGLRMIHEC